jgi:hypothetical protein
LANQQFNMNRAATMDPMFLRSMNQQFNAGMSGIDVANDYNRRLTDLNTPGSRYRNGFLVDSLGSNPYATRQFMPQMPTNSGRRSMRGQML